MCFPVSSDFHVDRFSVTYNVVNRKCPLYSCLISVGLNHMNLLRHDYDRTLSMQVHHILGSGFVIGAAIDDASPWYLSLMISEIVPLSLPCCYFTLFIYLRLGRPLTLLLGTSMSCLFCSYSHRFRYRDRIKATCSRRSQSTSFIHAVILSVWVCLDLALYCVPISFLLESPCSFSIYLW